MIDLKNVRHPVGLQPEDAIRLVDLLHDIKTDLAALQDPEFRQTYERVKDALRIVDGFIPSKEEANGTVDSAARPELP